MVLEICDGGNLSELISHRPDVALQKRVANHMLKGIAAIHAKQIVHRDIKPENFMLASGQDGPVVKLCDFGLSAIADAGPLIIRAGTLAFMAPEQHNRQEYHCPIDVWAAGCILYMLLHNGKHPWLHNDIVDLEGINKGMPENTSRMRLCNLFRTADDAGTDLSRKMLNSNPCRRPTASQAAQHSWFPKVEESQLSWSSGDRVSYTSPNTGCQVLREVLTWSTEAGLIVLRDDCLEIESVGTSDVEKISVEKPVIPKLEDWLIDSSAAVLV
jgi:calcium-dependent protein kinase